MYYQDEPNQDFAVPFIKKRDGKYYFLEEGTEDNWLEISKEDAEEIICREITGESKEVLKERNKEFASRFAQYPIRNLDQAGGGDRGPEEFGL